MNTDYKTFGGDYDDVGSAVVQTPDGGYLVVGTRYSGDGETLSDLYGISYKDVHKTPSAGFESTYGPASPSACPSEFVTNIFTEKKCKTFPHTSSYYACDVKTHNENNIGIQLTSKQYGYCINAPSGSGYVCDDTVLGTPSPICWEIKNCADGIGSLNLDGWAKTPSMREAAIDSGTKLSSLSSSYLCPSAKHFCYADVLGGACKDSPKTCFDCYNSFEELEPIVQQHYQ